MTRPEILDITVDEYHKLLDRITELEEENDQLKSEIRYLESREQEEYGPSYFS